MENVRKVKIVCKDPCNFIHEIYKLLLISKNKEIIQGIKGK